MRGRSPDSASSCSAAPDGRAIVAVNLDQPDHLLKRRHATSAELVELVEALSIVNANLAQTSYGEENWLTP